MRKMVNNIIPTGPPSLCPVQSAGDFEGYACPLTSPYTELSFHVYKWQSPHLALGSSGLGGKGG